MIGETIGNFRLVKRLGRGGMGEVFLAEHKDLQTPVAVKLLNPEISDDRDHVQRFFNEARIVSKIKHAGTVKIFDSGFHKDQAYLIMELLDGESLATRIERAAPMPIAKVIEIAREIASVLDATHRQGVIHRDLKPDNIYIVGDDERASGERVKVLDFGIAKLSGTMAILSPKTSGTMGTPAYMAPEQWGDSGQVDWRADAYSLGCVIFEMACGRPPFVASSIPEAYTKHAHTQPPAPSSLVPGLPAEFDALIARLLAKDPSERAVSMGQVTRELDELASGASSSVVAPPTQPRMTPAKPAPTITTLGGSAVELQPAPTRRPAIIGIAAAAVVVLVVVIVMMQGRSDGTVAAPPPVTPATAATVPPVVAPPAPVIPPPPAIAATGSGSAIATTGSGSAIAAGSGSAAAPVPSVVVVKRPRVPPTPPKVGKIEPPKVGKVEPPKVEPPKIEPPKVEPPNGSASGSGWGGRL